ncbi:hypothetical protein CHLNCDRAFT_139631 [Chlorella variabilis]|uniref:DNA mismatch repair protein MutS core domain-containing protein n=1 Tax=Chlorella variabilis TaxID=554065 RepID=E1ZQK6_CHLVA|nr:hypothetical protein CHLNCDRAFT_139631 [Chlorella variabilis]EFN52031.1 hypothetical protein CHLNCDRAFT_139631 [Chlorella variabilis]|eukprot:XP_005844133.1 hypothetical protein CHLNCDRAFT_139631 [Chlorella variabilis]
MAPKKSSEPLAGQRSISAFFAAKPKPAQADAAAASPAKLLKPAAKADVKAAKDSTALAAAAAAAPTQGAAPPAAAKSSQQAAAAPAAAAAAVPPRKAGKGKPAGKNEKSKGKAGEAAVAGSGAAAIGPDVVGKSVRVYWPSEGTWFTGDIQGTSLQRQPCAQPCAEAGQQAWSGASGRQGRRCARPKYNGASGKCLVLYDDGDEEWVDLRAEKFAWADRQQDKARQAAGRKRKAAIVESESEAEAGEASGSEYAASEDAESSDEEAASLADEEEDEDEEDEEMEEEELSVESGPPKGKRAAAASGGGGVKKAAAPRGGGKAGATPVAVNGSVGLTPGSAAAAGLPAAAGTAGRTAARPARPSLPALTPGTGATPASLARALGGTPLTGGAGEGDAPASALQEELAPRFSGRVDAAFPFLHPDRIRDAARRRPDDLDYDPRTLYVPPEWLRQNKVSPGQQQWWEFKAQHYDCVLLFKMGKFYELFEMDAHVAVEVLGLSYMKGDKPHAGFPEAAYHGMAERLARAGHKVVVIEQVETPEMLKARNEERARKGLKRDAVVRREKVAVLTQGTLTDAEMVAAQPEAAYLLALAELPVPDALMAAAEHSGAPPCVWVGACAVDAATGQMLVGQWLDDELRSQFWDAYSVWSQVDAAGYWPEGAALPPALHAVRAGGEAQAAAAHALGGCLSHLRCVLLDKQVLAAGRVEQLGETFGIGAGLAGSGCEAGGGGPTHMALDGAALENLEVLENSEGGPEGTLLAALDNCVTPAGRRRLRQWLCRPLARIPDIQARQDAVAELMGSAEEAAGAARALFKGVADLERAVARITAAGAGLGSARDAPHVILYEDVARRRVKAYAAALKGLQQIQDAAAAFQELGDGISSSLLRRLVTPGELFPDMAAALAEMQSATDWAEAEASGRVEPARGVDGAYDAALDAIDAAQAALQAHLAEARRAGARVPASWEPAQSKKGVKRYTSAALRELVKGLEAAHDAKEKAQGGILQGMMRAFSQRKALWGAAVDCMAQLDALMSLAVAAACGSGTMCRPKLVPWSPAGEAGRRAGGRGGVCGRGEACAGC